MPNYLHHQQFGWVYHLNSKNCSGWKKNRINFIPTRKLQTSVSQTRKTFQSCNAILMSNFSEENPFPAFFSLMNQAIKCNHHHDWWVTWLISCVEFSQRHSNRFLTVSNSTWQFTAFVTANFSQHYLTFPWWDASNKHSPPKTRCLMIFVLSSHVHMSHISPFFTSREPTFCKSPGWLNENLLTVNIKNSTFCGRGRPTLSSTQTREEVMGNKYSAKWSVCIRRRRDTEREKIYKMVANT